MLIKPDNNTRNALVIIEIFMVAFALDTVLEQVVMPRIYGYSYTNTATFLGPLVLLAFLLPICEGAFTTWRNRTPLARIGGMLLLLVIRAVILNVTLYSVAVATVVFSVCFGTATLLFKGKGWIGYMVGYGAGMFLSWYFQVYLDIQTKPQIMTVWAMGFIVLMSLITSDENTGEATTGTK